MNKLTTRMRAFSPALFLMTLILSVATAKADLVTDSTTAITALLGNVNTILAAVFTVVLAFVLFKVIKKAVNKI